MKRTILAIGVLIVAILAVACVNSPTRSSNMISPSVLSDKEKMFLSFAGTQYFAFDYVTDKEYRWAEIWVERYERGISAGDTGRMSVPLEPDKKGMLIATAEEKDNGICDWITGISAGGSMGKGESTQSFPLEENASLISASSQRHGEILIDESEIVLAGVCYKVNSTDGGSITALTDDFFNDPEDHQDELVENDLVYLVKCRFSKREQPN